MPIESKADALKALRKAIDANMSLRAHIEEMGRERDELQARIVANCSLIEDMRAKIKEMNSKDSQ